MASSRHSLSLTRRGGTVAIVGGESLLGKDIRDVVEHAAIPAQLKLISTSEHGTLITEAGGEPTVMTALQAADLVAAKVVLLAGTPESSRKAFELLQKREPMPVVIDASGGLEENPLARLRAPQVETSRPDSAQVQVIGHPAAIALALFLRQLRQAGPIRSCVIEIFEPASERGQPGLDELQQQTVGLLSFQKLKKQVYDVQVSFNLLPQYGEDAPRSLEDIELNIDRHLASLLSSSATDVPMPSLRLIQAPVFHGYSFSLWVEFEKNPGVLAISKILASNRIEVRANGDEPPSNVGIAGQSGLTVGGISVDRNNARACWFWMVADNLRIVAENAVEVARESLE